MYVYIYIYIHMYLYIVVYVSVCVCVCLYTQIYLYLYQYTHAYMHTHVCLSGGQTLCWGAVHGWQEGVLAWRGMHVCLSVCQSVYKSGKKVFSPEEVCMSVCQSVSLCTRVERRCSRLKRCVSVRACVNKSLDMWGGVCKGLACERVCTGLARVFLLAETVCIFFFYRCLQWSWVRWRRRQRLSLGAGSRMRL